MPANKTGRGQKRKQEKPDLDEVENESPMEKKPAVKSVRSKDKSAKNGKSSDSVGKKRAKSSSSAEYDSIGGEKNFSLENKKASLKKNANSSKKEESFLQAPDAEEKPSTSAKDLPSDAGVQPSSSKAFVDANANEKASSSARPFSHWLFKSEPDTRLENGIDMKFGFDDLKSEPDQTACWDGVRNYQARNFMKDQMRIGDKAFFYHSNTKPPGIIGLIDVVKESYVDHTQFDRKDPHYDPKATKEKPKWFMVDVKYNRPLKRYIPLDELKTLHHDHKKNKGPLRDLALFTKARLSVQPLTEEEFNFILGLEVEETQSDSD